MGFKTKVQRINRTNGQQWYVCFPTALAQAMEFQKSEQVEWILESKHKLVLWRREYRTSLRKKRVGNA